jgi:hypothetical protein
MYPTNATTRHRRRVLAKVAESNAQALRADRPRGALVVTIGNVDLPAYISDGVVYIQAPLPHVFDAFAEDISAFVNDMEVRISGARGRTLALDSHGCPVYGSQLAESSVVRGSTES